MTFTDTGRLDTMQKPRALTNAWGLRLVLVVVQGAALSLFSGAWPVINGFPLDDAWVHQVVARTLAASGTLGYSPGHHGAAATSYLWAALLSTNYTFFHFPPVGFTLALNASLTLLAGQFLFTLVEADAESNAAPASRRAVALAVASLACIGGNFLWFTFSGMEAMLLVTGSLATLAHVPLAGPFTPRRAAVAGLFAAIVALTRPDAIPLGGIVFLLAVAKRRDRRELAALAVPYGLAVAFYLGSNFVLIGAPVPATLNGRRWLWLANATGQSTIDIIWMFVEFWADRIRNYTLGSSSRVLHWIAMGLAVHGLLRVVAARATSTRLLALFAWVGLHFALYAVLLPTPGSGGRYQPLIPVAFLVAVAFGALDVGESLAAMIRRFGPWQGDRESAVAALLCTLAPWFLDVAWGIPDWRASNELAVSHVRTTEEGLPTLVNGLPPNARVGSFDIGASGFGSSRPIVDLGGLSDPATSLRMANGRLWEVVRDEHLDFVIIPGTYRLDQPDINNYVGHLALADNPAIGLQLVGSLSTPSDQWLPGALATWNNGPRQVLYKVALTGASGAHYEAKPSSGNWSMQDLDHLVHYRPKQQIEYGLGVMAGAGVQIDLWITEKEPRMHGRAHDARWAVELGPWGLRVDPSTPSVSQDEATARALELALPYVEANDVAGAAEAVLQGLARAVRANGDPAFYPKLPMLQSPFPDGFADDFVGSCGWGLLLAAALVAGAIRFRTQARGLGPVAGAGVR